MSREIELMAKLTQWVGAQPEPPSLFDVVETGDRELVAAFMLQKTRAAARKADAECPERIAAHSFASELIEATAALLRVFHVISRAWSLSDGERLALLGLADIAKLKALRTAPLDEVPTEIVERIALLLDIFKAIKTLLPQPGRADAWVRAPNSAPMFGGRSALDVIVGRGLNGLREVRAYLNAQIWST